MVRNLLYTELAAYYRSIKHNRINLPETKKSHLIIKSRSFCKNYDVIQVPYEYIEVINRLSKNTHISLRRQEKRRGIAIMDKKKYAEKSYEHSPKQRILKVTKTLCKNYRN